MISLICKSETGDIPQAMITWLRVKKSSVNEILKLYISMWSQEKALKKNLFFFFLEDGGACSFPSVCVFHRHKMSESNPKIQ